MGFILLVNLVLGPESNQALMRQLARSNFQKQIIAWWWSDVPEKPIPTGCGSDLLRLKAIYTAGDHQFGKGYIQTPLSYLLFDLASCFSRWNIIIPLNKNDITGKVFKQLLVILYWTHPCHFLGSNMEVAYPCLLLGIFVVVVGFTSPKS